MPRRRSRKAASEDEAPGEEEGAEDRIPADAEATSPSNADATPSNARIDRRAVMAEVARNRASFFARGGDAEVEENTPASTKRGKNKDEEEDDEPKQWPGPFATARNLLQGRTAAKAKREAKEGGRGNAGKSTDSPATGLTTTKIAVDDMPEYLVALRDFDCSDVNLEDYSAPPIPPLSAASLSASLHAHASTSHTPASTTDTSPSLSGRKRKRGADEIEAEEQPQVEAPERRRARAIAGPSGVTLTVPPLSTLAMTALIAHLHHIPAPVIAGLKRGEDGTVSAAAGVFVAGHTKKADTEPESTEDTTVEKTVGGDGEVTYEDFGLDTLMPNVRNNFVLAVCRARALNNHAFALFATSCSDSLVVPDCGGGM
jgi:hypothetical protein